MALLCIHTLLLYQYLIPGFAPLLTAFITSSPCSQVRGFHKLHSASTPRLDSIAETFCPGISEFLLPHLEPQQALGWLQNCRCRAFYCHFTSMSFLTQSSPAIDCSHSPSPVHQYSHCATFLSKLRNTHRRRRCIRTPAVVSVSLHSC